MVYKRYVKKRVAGRTKVFGPYYYESYRDKKGRTRTRYISNSKKIGAVTKTNTGKNFLSHKLHEFNLNKTLKLFFIFGIIGFLLITSLFFVNFNLTGKVSLNIKDIYSSNERLEGNMKVVLEKDEFIPSNTKVLINLNNNSYEYFLRELINEKVSSGNYYVTGKDISGSGEGYGFVLIPISFILNIYDKKVEDIESNKTSIEDKDKTKDENKTAEEIIGETNETASETNETETPQEQPSDVPTETPETTETPTEEILTEEPTIPPSDTSTTHPEETTATSAITGETSETPSTETSSSKSSSSPSSGESSSSDSGSSESIASSGESSSITGAIVKNIFGFFSNVFLSMTGRVSMELKDEVSGSVSLNNPFNYILREGQTASIKEGSVNTGNEGDVKLEIKDNTAIVTTGYTNQSERKIIIDFTKLNIPVEEGDLIVSFIYENVTLAEDSNKVKIQNASILNETEILNGTVETIQHKAVVGKPVKWIKRIVLNQEGLVNISIPESAGSVRVINSITNDTMRAEVISNTGEVQNVLSIIGNVISDLFVEQNVKQNTKEVVINENATEFEIEYETPAPVSVEENISGGKRIIISGPDELGYTNIIAFSELPYEISASSIKLYHWDNGSKILISTNNYDLNNNSLIDYIEWNVPHLSNQSYLLIIEISKAEHLDENRTFIEDISDSVKAQDGNWSPVINDSHYVRVTFEQNLTKDNDITVYAKTLNNETGNIDVYLLNWNESIARIENISSEGYYKTYLTGLGDNSEDEFDLKINSLNGIEFDYIVDPIIIVGDTSYNSVDVNVTQETGFAHLNITTLAPYNKLIGYWNADADNVSASTAFDLSEKGNNGVIGATANTTTGGIYGQAYGFNGAATSQIDAGTSDVVNIYNKNFTIMGWVKARDLAGWVPFFNKDSGGVQFWVGYATNPLFLLSSDGSAYTTVTGSSTMSTNVWYHITATYNSTTGVIYLNGEKNGSATFASPLYNGSGSKLMLGYSEKWNNLYSGLLDEVMMFNTTLNTSQILDIYNNQSARFSNYGNQTFGVNLSSAGTENTVNITLTNYQQLLGSNISVSINGAKPINFSGTKIINQYNFTGDPNNVSVSFLYSAGTNKFYSPFMIGNVTLDSYTLGGGGGDTTPPTISIIIPVNNSNTSNINQDVNYSASDASGLSSCWWTNNTGISNHTINDCATNITGQSWYEGINNITIYINDTAGNNNTANVRFYVDSIQPAIAIVTPVNNSNSSNINLDVNYTVSTDAQTCWWTNSSGINNKTITCGTNITGQTWFEGINNITIYVNDSVNNLNSSSVKFVVDTIAPTFIQLPPNITIVVGNAVGSDINATDSGVGVQAYKVNDTINFKINNSGFLENATALAVNFYLLNISVNDSVGNMNSSLMFVNVTLDYEYPLFSSSTSRPAEPATYQQGQNYTFNITISSTNATAGIEFNRVNYSASNLTKDRFNVTFQNLGVNNYTYYFWAYGNGTSHNYNISNSYSYNVSIATQTATLTINETSPIIYRTNINVTCNGNFLLRDNVNVNATENGLTKLLGGGTYIYSCQKLENQNYSYDDDNSTLVVNKFNQHTYTLLNGVNANLSVIYPQQINVSVSQNETATTIKLNGTSLTNGLNYTIGAGVWNVNVSAVETQNYSSNETHWYVEINQSTQTITTLLNGVAGNLSRIYPQPANVTVSGNSTTATINVNGTTFASGYNYTLGSNVWFVNVTATENQNYSKNNTYWNIEVNKTLSEVNLSLNSTEGNITLTNGATALLNGTLITGDAGNLLQLFRNRTQINQKTREVSNVSTFNQIFNFNITIIYSASQNYTQSSETYWLNVSESPDIIPPNISISYPTNNSNTSNINIDVNYSVSGDAQACYWTNNSGINNHTISCAINLTGMSWFEGANNVTIYANDSVNNLNSSSVRFIVDTVYPTFSNFLDNSGSLTDSGTAWFNASINSTNGTAILTFNGINYTATNLTTNVYNVSLSVASSGTYSYFWNSYGNGTLHNYNSSATRNYVVNAGGGGGTGGGTGGGGGGGGTAAPVIIKPQFDVSSSSYQKTIALGKIESDSITVTNNAFEEKTFTIEVEDINNIISVEQSSFKISAGDSKDLKFRIIAPADTGIYTGRIIVTSGASSAEILVNINVKTEKSLFDVSLAIPKELKILSSGQNIKAQIDLLQMGVKEKIDVTINYLIKNFNGQTVFTESETFSVTDQKSYVKELDTSKLSPGDYVFGAELIYSDGVAVASSQFKIKEEGIKGRDKMLTILVLALLIISITIGLAIRRNKIMIKSVRGK